MVHPTKKLCLLLAALRNSSSFPPLAYLKSGTFFRGLPYASAPSMGPLLQMMLRVPYCIGWKTRYAPAPTPSEASSGSGLGSGATVHGADASHVPPAAAESTGMFPSGPASSSAVPSTAVPANRSSSGLCRSSSAAPGSPACPAAACPSLSWSWARSQATSSSFSRNMAWNLATSSMDSVTDRLTFCLRLCTSFPTLLTLPMAVAVLFCFAARCVKQDMQTRFFFSVYPSSFFRANGV
mmetsp:Transcript_667/g.1936  ORF Transcript_667/g.1936 Transcript_667/m.1936 type:complete len:238 (+) Transcript_667:1398-2111(+)